MKKIFFSTLLLLTAAVAGRAQQACVCTATAINFNTGVVRPANTLIPIGGSDAAWTLITAPTSSMLGTPATPFVIAPSSVWGSSTPADLITMTGISRWISPFNSATYSVNNPAPDSPFVFEFKFCVCKAGNFKFEGMANADDEAVLKVDNSTTLVSCPSWASVHKFNVTLPLTAGSHTMTIRLRNTGSQVMGVNVNGTIQAIGAASLMGYDCCNRVGGIRGQKFEDVNCNGKLDTGDVALQGWTMTLMPGSYTAVTDILGYYFFPDLPPGTYTVTETNQPGWTPVSPLTQTATVTAGNVTTVNFLNSKCITSRCNDTCYWKVTGNSILAGNNIFGTLSNDDIRIQSAAANRGIITRNGLLGWNTMAPTAFLHVNCNGNNQENGSLSDVRFERLERGTGNILVINQNGYVMDSKIPITAISAPAAMPPGLQQLYEKEKARNDRMEQELNELKARMELLLPSSGERATGALGNRSMLYQNTPNPYDIETSIGYFIAGNPATAYIVITDAVGKEWTRYPVKGTGEGHIKFRNSSLAQGVYYYTLFVDGEKVDSKKMVYKK